MNGLPFGSVLGFVYADSIIPPLVNIYRRYYGPRLAVVLFGSPFVASGDGRVYRYGPAYENWTPINVSTDRSENEMIAVGASGRIYRRASGLAGSRPPRLRPTCARSHSATPTARSARWRSSRTLSTAEMATRSSKHSRCSESLRRSMSGPRRNEPSSGADSFRQLIVRQSNHNQDYVQRQQHRY